MKKINQPIIIVSLCIVACLGITLASIMEPIAQDTTYHNFADKRNIGIIKNAWNVMSNFPFLLVGIYGLIKLNTWKYAKYIGINTYAYTTFYLGVACVSFGSAYYHWFPTNQTLLWDRLPMTFAFMGLFSILVSEFIHKGLGKMILLPLLLSGITSVLYWYWTELKGMGNLNYYALVQFYPMICIPIFLLFYKPSFTRLHAYWVLLGCYVLAKITEHYDDEIYMYLEFISGHTLKHLAAVFGLFYLSIQINRRTIISEK